MVQAQYTCRASRPPCLASCTRHGGRVGRRQQAVAGHRTPSLKNPPFLSPEGACQNLCRPPNAWRGARAETLPR